MDQNKSSKTFIFSTDIEHERVVDMNQAYTKII